MKMKQNTHSKRNAFDSLSYNARFQHDLRNLMTSVSEIRETQRASSDPRMKDPSVSVLYEYVSKSIERFGSQDDDSGSSSDFSDDEDIKLKAMLSVPSSSDEEEEEKVDEKSPKRISVPTLNTIPTPPST